MKEMRGDGKEVFCFEKCPNMCRKLDRVSGREITLEATVHCSFQQHAYCNLPKRCNAKFVNKLLYY